MSKDEEQRALKIIRQLAVLNKQASKVAEQLAVKQKDLLETVGNGKRIRREADQKWLELHDLVGHDIASLFTSGC